MSKQKSPKTSSPAPKANGIKLTRELIGLILLFFGLYLLLSLLTFDARDPGFNHAISTAKGVHNSAGVIGSYLAGMLTDIFGVVAYIWPAFILLLAMRQLFFRFTVQWWRCLGFVCLLLCFMMASTAWEFQLGDIVGGGFIGDSIYGITWRFLSGTGSFLLGFCFFLISIQLMFNLSWLTLWRAFCIWIASCWNDMRVSVHEASGKKPDNDPTSPNPKSKQKESKASLIEKKQAMANARSNVAPTKQALDDKNSNALNLLARVKSIFTSALKEQKLPAANAQHPLKKQNPELAVFPTQNVEAGPATAPVDVATPHLATNPQAQKIATVEQDSRAQTQQVSDTFLQESQLACPNPFASPWARACDIQAEWAQPAEPVAEWNAEQVATVTPDYMENAGEAKAPDAAQNDSNPEEFLFDTSPENNENVYTQDTAIIDNTHENISDVEIELDATMAVQPSPESAPSENVTYSDVNNASDADVAVSVDDVAAASVDSAEEVEPNDEARRDAIAATLRDLQNMLDQQLEGKNDVQGSGLTAVPYTAVTPTCAEPPLQVEAVAYAPPVSESNSPSKAEESFVSTSYVEEQDYIEANTSDETIEVADTLEEFEDDMPPSFEVLMDADKDGITDLTEEEVGTGGAAKAAPVKIKTRLPHLDLLQDVEDDEYSKPRLDILTEKGERLTQCLADFAIHGELTRITPGPVVTMFEFRPAPGIKVSRIANLSDDLALALKAIAVRIQAPIPGTDTVGIEIPNEMRETIYFKDLLASDTFHDASSLLTLAVGKDSAGRPSVADLAKMPHLLVAGATGAGKSVCLNSILLSFLYKARPEDVQLLLIDPKRIELAVYADLPHLVHPVVTDMSHAKNALEWAVQEMDKRYEGMARLGVRNIASYNQKLEGFGNEKPIEYFDLEFMPYLVIIIDELADLMLTAAKEVETSIVRLAQLARAAGIHMVLATQRPSVDVVTGLIKANFPCRISFQVTSKHDSRTILDTVGAEHLLGRGDMLFKPSGGRLQRLHGAFVSDDEVANVVEFWKRQQAPMYRVDFAQWGTDAMESLEGCAGALADDPIYNDAVEFVLSQGQASISLIQRRFRIGFNKAARYVEQMELDGFVGPANGSKPRPVIKGHEIQ